VRGGATSWKILMRISTGWDRVSGEMDRVDNTAEDIPGALLPENLLLSPTITDANTRSRWRGDSMDAHRRSVRYVRGVGFLG